jgi:transcriptional regulator of acetoin/glycerol metabolism
VSDEVMRFFESYAWPGNIRQLQNVLRVALALLDDGERVILPQHLPEEIFAADPAVASAPPVPARASATDDPMPVRLRGRRLQGLDEDMIRRVLAEHGGNVSAAARVLGIARNTLYRKLGRDF